jgi:hypothetical protein
MGDRRPDQIDSRIGRTTDLKNLTDDEHVKNEAKQDFQGAQSHDQPMIPEAGTNPALRELHERKEQKKGDDQSDGIR